MSNLLRPNSIMIQRHILGTVSATGEPTRTIVNVDDSIPALIDPAANGELTWLVEGTIFTQDAMLFIDGIRPQRFIGTPPGGTYTLNTIGYVVASNGLAAFPDVQINDRITDETLNQYIVLAVMKYYGPLPSLEARLARGRTW